MIIKVCGMREAENIRAADALPIQMMGFIFYPQSARYVASRPEYLPRHARRVGVFVDEEANHILRIAKEYGLDYIQLHGHESPELCRQLTANGLGVIKTISVSAAEDFAPVSRYESSCAFLLFDTQTPQYGGSGKPFDWDLLQHYRGETPFLLSGGISPQDAERIRNLSHPRWAGIDLNSRFERSPGHKEITLLNDFIHRINHP